MPIFRGILEICIFLAKILTPVIRLNPTRQFLTLHMKSLDAKCAISVANLRNPKIPDPFADSASGSRTHPHEVFLRYRSFIMTFFNSKTYNNNNNNNNKRTIISLLNGGVDILINLTYVHMAI